MLTFVLIALLALIAFAYVALPLLLPTQADPLPDLSDPVLAGLREERNALFRAIKELDTRVDLPAERRQQLKDRYEVRAAKTLSAIDDRNLELQNSAPRPSGPASAGRKRAPLTAIALLAVVVVTAVALPSFVLPRIGQDGTVTTTDVAAATQLRDLQRAAQNEPTAENLLALGDMYLNLQELADAEATYQRILEEVDPVPAAAYQRLTVIALGRDVQEAQQWLSLARAADPDDLDTLFLLSEVAFANGDLALALDSLRDFMARSPEEPDASVTARLALLERATELDAAITADPSVANLLALGDLYWQAGDNQRAVSIYFRILTEVDPQQPLALARTGEAMLVAGSPEDAAALLERAAIAAGSTAELEQGSLLTLGNARFQLGDYAGAATIYRQYLQLHDDPGENVTRLLESATALAGGEEDPHASDDAVVGQLVFAANCAQCHGQTGGGGMSVALAGNSRAANEANVRDAVSFGRGAMPGFAAQLSAEELDAVVDFVTSTLAPGP